MWHVPYKYIAHTNPHPRPHPMPHHLPHPKSRAHNQPNALAARAFSSDPRFPPRHHPPPKRSDATKSHTAPTSSCSCNYSFAQPIFFSLWPPSSLSAHNENLVRLLQGCKPLVVCLHQPHHHVANCQPLSEYLHAVCIQYSSLAWNRTATRAISPTVSPSLQSSSSGSMCEYRNCSCTPKAHALTSLITMSCPAALPFPLLWPLPNLNSPQM